MAGLISVLCVLMLCFHGSKGSFLEINYPNVKVIAEPKGNVIVQGGVGGDILLYPGNGGTLFINQYDIEDIIARVRSMPPVWTRQTVHDSLGTFDAGREFNVSITALDPEGDSLIYQLISGRLPPGIKLNNETGVISGIAPNYDATYSFSIRVTDVHGKYADGSFSIDIRERELCSSGPCSNGGLCRDVPGGFQCVCKPLYGGDTCNVLCSKSPLGIGVTSKKVPDAQITAHYSYNGSKASDARLRGPLNTGWIGTGLGAWLQVDLNTVKKINGIATEGVNINYYVSQFILSYSTDGNVFSNVTDPTSGGPKYFSGSATYMIPHIDSVDPPINARFIRIMPTSWHKGLGTHPGLRLELYGC